MNAIENLLKRLRNKKNLIEFNTSFGKQEYTDHHIREIYNADRSRKFVFYYVNNNPLYLNICLQVRVGESWMNLFRALQIDSNGLIYPAIFFEAINERQDQMVAEIVGYFSSDAGMVARRLGFASPITNDKYFNPRKYMEEQGFYTQSQIPEQIAVEKTTDAFIQQVRGLNFSTPKLITTEKLNSPLLPSIGKNS